MKVDINILHNQNPGRELYLSSTQRMCLNNLNKYMEENNNGIIQDDYFYSEGRGLLILHLFTDSYVAVEDFEKLEEVFISHNFKIVRVFVRTGNRIDKKFKSEAVVLVEALWSQDNE